MSDDVNNRIIFRPTPEQHKRLYNLLNKSGRYKHLSELLRHIVEIGLKELEQDG